MPDLVVRSMGHLGTALWLVLFRPVRSEALRARFGDLVLIAALCIAAQALFEFAGAGENPWFNVWGIVSAIAEWTVLGVLVAALKSTHAFRTIDVLVAVGAVGTWLITISALVLLAPPYAQKVGNLSPQAIEWASFGALWLVFAWSLVAHWRIGRTATAGRRRQLGLGLVAAVMLSSFVLPSTPMLRGSDTDAGGFSLVGMAADWSRTRTKADTDTTLRPIAIDVERAYYRQFKLLDTSYAALDLSPENQPAMYFLGFAGYSGQNVFRSELSQARDLFDHRFATQGRSMLLVNHRDTVEETPLASVTNLAMALERLGHRMDRDKDILFLFLTSHGSEGALSVSFPRFSLNDLTPDSLRVMLDHSGIKNRVVVISACHSGSFISALQDPHTLVMTASRPDRSSFGCDDKREWTYFGDALFNRALRQTRSLLRAFDLAKETVSGWEKAEKLPPSEPQIFVGESIEARLKSWEQTLTVAETERSEASSTLPQ